MSSTDVSMRCVVYVSVNELSTGNLALNFGHKLFSGSLSRSMRSKVVVFFNIDFCSIGFQSDIFFANRPVP